MATVAPVPVPAQPTLEQRLDTAALQASQIVSAFSPGAAVLIQTGVAVEPVIGGLVHMIAGIFKHHAKQAVAGK